MSSLEAFLCHTVHWMKRLSGAGSPLSCIQHCIVCCLLYRLVQAHAVARDAWKISSPSHPGFDNSNHDQQLDVFPILQPKISLSQLI